MHPLRCIIFLKYLEKRRNMETKNDRFVRIAEARTNKIIDMIRLLGNCSNKATYDYSKEDVRKIFTTIENELKTARAKFDSSSEDSVKFKLK